MKRYFGAEGICLTNDLSVSIRASKAMQKAVKKANADAATGELKCLPKAEVIAAMIGIPIPAKSIIVANDSMLPPLVMFVFLSIIRFENLFLSNEFKLFCQSNDKIICLIHQQIWHFLGCIEIEARAFFP